MTVYDFVDISIEPSFQKIELYDCNSGEIVFKGMADEIPYRLENLEICSMDCTTKGNDAITLNVEIE